MSIDNEGTSDLLAAAHDYAKRGWRVIPLHRVNPAGDFCSCRAGGRCTSKGKHPINAEWQNQPALTGADIQETWDVDKKPNLGLAVGERSGFWVLDIDPDHGGFETMQALVAEHGRLPETFVVKSGSGGFHYYFAMPEGIELRNTQGRVGEGIDTRATGGQVVAAPSRTDKGTYEVFTDAPLAQAPAWLLEAVKKEEVDPESIVTAADLPKPEDMEPAEWERLNAYAEKAIKGNLDRLDAMKAAATKDPATYRGEPWNATTFQVAAALIEIANSPWCSYGMGQAYADVFAHAPRDLEFDDYIVNRTFESAREKVGEKARPVPEDRRSEPDPLFTSPDVRQGPTRADGEPTGPVSGGPVDSSILFEKKSLLTARAALAVLDMGPLAWGRDEAFWSFHGGVWKSDRKVVRSRLGEILGDEYKPAHAAQVGDWLETYLERKGMKVSGDKVPQWMNFRNGMLDWKTGEMHAHDWATWSTIQFPYDWDETATCPAFDAFLSEVMHPDYVALCWEMLGYLMLSDNDLQHAFLLYGSGGNGKGTLMRVITDLLGPDNIASESLDDLNGNRFSAVNLFGKIANLAGDIDGTYQESTANFKKLTGEDMIPAERKFGDRFDFKSWAVPVFSANKIPGSADVTPGYLRRWIVLHFHKRITKPIPGLSDTLVNEIPGIAAKAVRALRALDERGGFDPQGEAVKGKEEFALAIDQVRQWIESGDPIVAPAQATPLRDLYASYCAWAGRSGQGRLRESEFHQRLKGIGFDDIDEQGHPQIRGLSVIVQAYSPSGSFFGAVNERED